MTRRLQVCLLMPVLVFMLTALAADPQPKQKPLATEKDEAALEQERLSRQFREFEASLLRLAQRLERSSKPEDRDRAVTLKAAIKKAREAGIDTRFETLIGLLRNSNSLDYAEMKEAMEQSKSLASDIRTVLDLLTNDNDAARLKAEKEHIQKMLEMLEKVIREQKIVRAQTEGRLTEKGTLSKAQEKVLKSTRDIAKAMKEKDAKGSENKGESKGEKAQGENKRQNKDGNKGDKGKNDKQGQNKGEKQSKGQGKSQNKNQGEGKEGGQENGQQQQQNQDQQPQQQLPGQKQVQDATRDQNNAQKNIDKDKNDEASKNQDDAIKKLEEVRKQWEELLRQLREEEMKRLLEALQSRCQRMLALQLEVYDGTMRIHKDIADSPEKKASRAEEQRSLQLSDREQQIVGIANQAIRLLETEGSAVAFPEAFHQVKDDATQVARRLGKADVGTVTQVTEQDIIATLKEMIEALEKAKQELQNRQQNRQQQQQSAQQQGNQPLIDRIAELKMIRSMQIRVNGRTLTYAKQYPGEQANDPDIQKELSNLAERQQKIFNITNNIARGKNK